LQTGWSLDQGPHQPVCPQHYTFLKILPQTNFFQIGADGFFMAAILYASIQWVKIRCIRLANVELFRQMIRTS